MVRSETRSQRRRSVLDFLASRGPGGSLEGLAEQIKRLGSVILTLLLSAGLIAAGIVRIYLASQLPAGQPRALVFLAAFVTILLGLIIVSHWPMDSVYVLGTLLGVDLLFHGVGWVSFGMGLQSRN